MSDFMDAERFDPFGKEKAKPIDNNGGITAGVVCILVILFVTVFCCHLIFDTNQESTIKIAGDNVPCIVQFVDGGEARISSTVRERK